MFVIVSQCSTMALNPSRLSLHCHRLVFTNFCIFSVLNALTLDGHLLIMDNG